MLVQSLSGFAGSWEVDRTRFPVRRCARFRILRDGRISVSVSEPLELALDPAADKGTNGGGKW